MAQAEVYHGLHPLRPRQPFHRSMQPSSCEDIGHFMGFNSIKHTFNKWSRTNKTIWHMLCHYVLLQMDDWDKHLDMVQFAINNCWCIATGFCCWMYSEWFVACRMQYSSCVVLFALLERCLLSLYKSYTYQSWSWGADSCVTVSLDWVILGRSPARFQLKSSWVDLYQELSCVV